MSIAWACSSRHTHEGVTLMVSVEPQRWLLEQLVDTGAVGIQTMLTRGADPETFEPTMRQRGDASAAEIYFATGALPFEKNLANATRNFVDTSAGIEPVFGTHGHSHADDSDGHDGAPDPHVWTSVSGARTIARNMATALTETFPASAADIKKRLEKLEIKLDSIDTATADKLKNSHNTAFAIWHPSLSYFARDYGLHQIAVGQENKEMSARQMREVIDHATADSVHVLFFQKEYDIRQARTINDALGSRLVIIDPLDYQWEKQITLIADELSRP